MEAKYKSALFPGTFELFHEGHINVLLRAAKLFDFVYVVVSINEQKSSSPLIERYENTKRVVDTLNLNNVEVILNDGLVSKIALKTNSHYIIRGIRNYKDLEYEKRLFSEYKKHLDSLEMVLFFTEEKLKNFSSSNLKEVKK